MPLRSSCVGGGLHHKPQGLATVNHASEARTRELRMPPITLKAVRCNKCSTMSIYTSAASFCSQCSTLNFCHYNTCYPNPRYRAVQPQSRGATAMLPQRLSQLRLLNRGTYLNFDPVNVENRGKSAAKYRRPHPP